MLQFFDTLTDLSGNALLGATVTVTNYPAGTPASIYSSNGTTQPIVGAVVSSDVTGQVSFFVPDGAYTLVYTYKGVNYKTRSPVQLIDPMGFVAATDTGAANAMVVAGSQYPAQKYVGLKLEILAAATNTGATTLNYQADGGEPVHAPGGGTLASGAIQANGLVRLEWDGAQWQAFAAAASASNSIVSYGGDPSGVADSSAALTAALAANAIVTIPPGTFKFNQATVFQCFGKRIQGAGANATILQFPNTSGAFPLQFGGTDTASPGVSGCWINGGPGTNSTAYGGYQLAQNSVGCRRGRFIDLIVSGFTRSDAIIWTTTLSGGATVGTLSSAWALPTNFYSILFSDGEVRVGYFQNGSTGVTWPDGLTNNVSTTALALTAYGIDLNGASGQGVYYNKHDSVSVGALSISNITFTSGPSSGATSATLNANWTGTTGVYAVQFSDNEMRLVTLTNGATTATWVIGLINTVTTAGVVTGGCSNGWRIASSDGPSTSTNRANCNEFAACGGDFNVGDCFQHNYSSANCFTTADMEVHNGSGHSVGISVFGLTGVGGDNENNAGGSLTKHGGSSDIHVFGSNVAVAPGALLWTVSDHWLPGGSQATNLGIAPNSFASSNLVIGGGVINLTATNPVLRLSGASTVVFNNTNKSMAVVGSASQNNGTPPAQVTGWGTPTSPTVVNNFSGSAATLVQCSEAIAEIITYLKSRGDFGA